MSEEKPEEVIGDIVKVFLDKCNGCMNCLKACTVNVFRKVKVQGSFSKVHPINEEECFFCLLCELACPTNAIEIKSYTSTHDTLKALLDYDD